MDQFILFGDSITQQASAPERGYLGPALSDAYVRKLDIINRGFSGYNTTQALQILPLFMPRSSQAKVRFLIIFFGANDARLPNTPGGPDQHVPLEQYKDNLRAIVTHPCVKAHGDIRIILVTPPPVDERKLIQEDRAKGLGLILRRTAKMTSIYARAVEELGLELQVPVLDLWRSMVQRAGYTPDELELSDCPGSMNARRNTTLQALLFDGLHFSRDAYVVLHEELMGLIEREWPDQMPDRLPFVLPRWDDSEAWKDDDSSGVGKGVL